MPSLVMLESSDKMWSTAEGNGRPLQYSCIENPMNSMKKQKDMTLKDEFPRSVSSQYATGEEWRNSSRKNEEAGPKWKRCSAVDISAGDSKVRCCKEQYLRVVCLALVGLIELYGRSKFNFQRNCRNISKVVVSFHILKRSI